MIDEKRHLPQNGKVFFVSKVRLTKLGDMEEVNWNPITGMAQIGRRENEQQPSIKKYKSNEKYNSFFVILDELIERKLSWFQSWGIRQFYLNLRGRMTSHFHNPFYMALMTKQMILKWVTTFVLLVSKLHSTILSMKNQTVSHNSSYLAIIQKGHLADVTVYVKIFFHGNHTNSVWGPFNRRDPVSTSSTFGRKNSEMTQLEKSIFDELWLSNKYLWKSLTQ